MVHKTIIWDLSGTLFKPSIEGMSHIDIDAYSLLCYIWSGKKEPTRLDRNAFNILTQLNSYFPNTSQTLGRTHTGAPLPEIIHQNLAGILSSQQALALVKDFLKSWRPHDLTNKDIEEIHRMLETLYEPLSLARCMKPIPSVVELMMRTIESGACTYILSNWDQESFIPFYQKFQNTIFAALSRDQIVISADTGYVKPQKEIYEWLISHKKLNPSTCLYIDDQEENVIAGASLGLESVHINVLDLGPLKRVLRDSSLI